MCSVLQWLVFELMSPWRTQLLVTTANVCHYRLPDNKRTYSERPVTKSSSLHSYDRTNCFVAQLTGVEYDFCYGHSEKIDPSLNTVSRNLTDCGHVFVRYLVRISTLL